MIFGLLRIKNEARWIERVIRSIQPVCDKILILDDHSADATPEICESLGCIVYRSTFEGLQEARDREFLLSKVWENGAQIGDHCIMIDGDEALHQDDVPLVKQAIAAGIICASFRILYLWDRTDQVRVDRWYKSFTRPSLFRLTSHDLTFMRNKNGGNLHCSSAPIQLLGTQSPLPVRLLHFGYMYQEDRIRKFRWYNEIDGNNSYEDGYRHMVIGDLFPADSSFKWAGPLQLEAL